MKDVSSEKNGKIQRITAVPTMRNQKEPYEYKGYTVQVIYEKEGPTFAEVLEEYLLAQEERENNDSR